MDNPSCETPVSRSRVMILAILNDIADSYKHEGGGGITEIKQTATDTFRVSIAQEERIDLITYSLSVSDTCEVSVVKKELDASTPWEG